MKISVTQSSMPMFNEYVEEIKDLWENRWLTNMGIKHKKLENELKNYLKTSNITLFANGHLALESAIESFRLKGEVITTPFTFVSTTHAIVRNGLTPVFCDINPENFTIDPEKIEKIITDKTTAIVPVHVYGTPCNVYAIDKIAKKYNLKVIYDAAHAFGVNINNESIANFGDATMFSFHATKVFHTVEGGAVSYRDNNLKKSLDSLKNFGITGEDTVESVGGNGKMNEFQAAMGICNLRYFEENLKKRKLVVERYIENFKNINGIKLLPSQYGVESNYAYFPIVFENFKKTRDDVYNCLKLYNVYTRKYFYPITTEFDCYKDKFKMYDTPIAKHISEHILTLPLYSTLTLNDVDRICDIILN